MIEYISPNEKHIAKWRWGGEMWMSGPEWGYLAIGESHEIKGATSDVLWSPSSDFIAFVKLHIDDVPNRKGAEGMSFRIAVIRISDFRLRYFLGNKRLSDIKLVSLNSKSLEVSVNGEKRSIDLGGVDWGE